MSKPLELVLRGLLKEHGVDFIEKTKQLLGDLDEHKWYLSEQTGFDVGYDLTIVDWVAKYGRFENPDILKIEQEYKSGKYKVLEEKLAKFVSKNKGLIEKVQNRYSADRILSLKLFLLQRKSIDMPIEVGMQIEEIKKEAWYRGSQDYNSVALDWAKQHAAGWRDNYTLVLAYILEVKKEKFQQLL